MIKDLTKHLGLKEFGDDEMIMIKMTENCFVYNCCVAACTNMIINNNNNKKRRKRKRNMFYYVLNEHK